MSPLEASATFDTSSVAPSEAPFINDLSRSSTASTVTVSIPLSSLLSPEEIARLDTFIGKCGEKFWITKLVGRKKQKKSAASAAGDREAKENVGGVQMSQAEYEAFRARDQDGE
ncbi:MAG: hypothetical protein Q9191_005721 [Dirinaria sp. TL-2023a]